MNKHFEIRNNKSITFILAAFLGIYGFLVVPTANSKESRDLKIDWLTEITAGEEAEKSKDTKKMVTHFVRGIEALTKERDLEKPKQTMALVSMLEKVAIVKSSEGNYEAAAILYSVAADSIGEFVQAGKDQNDKTLRLLFVESDYRWMKVNEGDEYLLATKLSKATEAYLKSSEILEAVLPYKANMTKPSYGPNSELVTTLTYLGLAQVRFEEKKFSEARISLSSAKKALDKCDDKSKDCGQRTELIHTLDKIIEMSKSEEKGKSSHEEIENLFKKLFKLIRI